MVPEVSFLNDISLVNSGEKIFIQCVVKELGKSILWKIDTGSEISFLSSMRIPAHAQLDLQPTSLTAVTANGSEMLFSKKAQLTLSQDELTVTHLFYICDIECHSILGMDFLRRHEATIDLCELRFLIAGARLPLLRTVQLDCHSIYLTEEVQLAASVTTVASCSPVSWKENSVFSLLFIPAVKRKEVELQAAYLDSDGVTRAILTNSGIAQRHACSSRPCSRFNKLDLLHRIYTVAQ